MGKRKKMASNILKYKAMRSLGWKSLIIVLLMLPIISMSQIQDLKSDEEVMVIAPFNPTISKAHKINFTPSSDTSHTHKLKIDYLTTPRLFETNFSLEKLTAAKFIDRKRTKDAQNYVKAGFGMYTSPYVEIFVNNVMSTRSQVGLHIRHLSTAGGIKEMAYSGSSLSSAEVWTKHIRRKQSTKVSVDYKRNQIHYYGFSPSDYPVELQSTSNDFKDDINQVYSHARLHLDMKGNFDKKTRDWAMDLSYKFFWDHFNSQEHLVDLKAYSDYPVSWLKSKEQYIGVAFSTQTYNTKQSFTGNFPVIDSAANYFHGLYDINPYYSFDFESISVKIGAKLSLALDTNAHVGVAPIIKLDIRLLGDNLKLYGLVDGGFYNNSISSLSSANHFISPIVPLKYTETKYKVQAGLKGHYLSFLDFHTYVETTTFENMPMFITDTLSQFQNSFTTIYDGGSNLSAGMELLFKTDRWNVKFNGKYQSYTLDTSTRAWQKPEFLYELGVSYYVMENLKVTGLLIGQSKMYALYQGEKMVDQWMDFNLITDYHISKNLGLFLNVTNIFSNQYQIWYGYPVQGIGVLGGVHFSF